MIKLNKLIRDIVDLLIKKYETRDPFLLMGYLNIELVEAPLGRLMGCYMPLWGTKCIFLNSDIENQYLRSTVAAHELGHSLLHMKAGVNCSFLKKYTLYSKNTYEIEANTFAAELLIENIDFEKYQGYTFEQIAAEEHILPELLKLKL